MSPKRLYELIKEIIFATETYKTTKGPHLQIVTLFANKKRKHGPCICRNPYCITNLLNIFNLMKTNFRQHLAELLLETKSDILANLSLVDKILEGLVESDDEPVKIATENQQVSAKSHTYNIKWPYPDKFVYLLKRESRFLHFREAAELISEIEGGDPGKILAKLSSSTHVLKKKGIIIKHQASKKLRDTFWGSPKWIDEVGNIKDPYSFNQKYLYKNNREYRIDL